MSDHSKLSTRVHNALFCVNALEPEVAANMTRAELLKLPNIGRKGLTEIEDWLASYGLCPAGSRPLTEVVGSDIRSLIDRSKKIIRLLENWNADVLKALREE